MNEKAVPYLYSVLQLTPRVERGEAMNIGLVVFCRPQRFLRVGYQLDAARINAFAPGVDLAAIERRLENMAHIAAGEEEGGPVSALDMGERFHWLTNISNTVIQPTPVHPGLTSNTAATFDKLFTHLVAPVHSTS